MFDIRYLPSYHGLKHPNSGIITIVYDDKCTLGEEIIYNFKPDGSASARWVSKDVKTVCPAGTFSDLMLSLSKKDELNSQIAKKLVDRYEKTSHKKVVRPVNNFSVYYEPVERRPLEYQVYRIETTEPKQFQRWG